MDWVSNRWLSMLFLALAIVATSVYGEDSDPKQDIELQLVEKFSKGKYSRKGANDCLRCHDDESEQSAMGIFDNIHGNVRHPDSPMNANQCEACHGPLGNHARKPRGNKPREPMITFGDLSPVSAEKQNSVCLSCHTDSGRAAWHSSEHAFEDLSCSSCHKVHQKQDPVMVPELQTEVCTNCHVRTKSDLHKRTSHPILNGDMTCSNCHDAHQTVNEYSLKWRSINDSCFECHAEKRGPNLWEHEPVSEDCSLCHNPHGSINQALLIKRPPQLCQDCHKVPHANVDVPNGDLRVRGGSCMNCHTQVHGSNHPRGRVLSH